jgi:histidinol-phosphatase (PHP family)
MIDSHSHSIHSHDGNVGIKVLADKAKSLGAEYIAITEHLDRDYLYCGLSKERFIRQLDLNNYYKDMKEVQAAFSGIYLAYGVEASYMAKANARYQKELAAYPFDVIINSVHTVYGGDVFLGKAYRGRTREAVFNEYLDAVLESVRAPYEYDIVGHIGYISRYAPYENKSLCTPEFHSRIDEILTEIIRLDKTIECNTNAKMPGLVFLPELYILKRYYELGGRRITFSSDAHVPERVCDKYRETADIVKDLGFSHWTIYKKRIPYEIPIE